LPDPQLKKKRQQKCLKRRFTKYPIDNAVLYQTRASGLGELLGKNSGNQNKPDQRRPVASSSPDKLWLAACMSARRHSLLCGAALRSPRPASSRLRLPTGRLRPFCSFPPFSPHFLSCREGLLPVHRELIAYETPTNLESPTLAPHTESTGISHITHSTKQKTKSINKPHKNLPSEKSNKKKNNIQSSPIQKPTKNILSENQKQKTKQKICRYPLSIR
jgi:hypothetical protein